MEELLNIIKILENISYKYELIKVLEKSLFYYCCGKDITPILAFKDKYQLYIYDDILKYKNYQKETEQLYDRLISEGFILKYQKDVSIIQGNSFFENATFTIWQTTDNKFFSLLYIQEDCVKVFKALFFRDYLIYPKCITNIRYELTTSFFNQIEKEVEYVLGYCFSKNHIAIGEVCYKGDYGKEKVVKLFKKY